MQVAQGGHAPTYVDPEELRRRFAHGEAFAVIDVRSPDDVRTSGVTVPGAIRLPAADLERRAAEIPRGRTVLIVAEDAEGEAVARRLLHDGYHEVHLIEGGFDAYVRAGGVTVPT